MKFTASAIVASAFLLQDAAGRGMLVFYINCLFMTLILSQSSNVLPPPLSRTLASVVFLSTTPLTPCLSLYRVRTLRSLGHTTGTKHPAAASTQRSTMSLCYGVMLQTLLEAGPATHKPLSTLEVNTFSASTSLISVSPALELRACKCLQLSRLGNSTWSPLQARHFSAPLLSLMEARLWDLHGFKTSWAIARAAILIISTFIGIRTSGLEQTTSSNKSKPHMPCLEVALCGSPSLD
jgi:hypothetical protein